MSGASHKSGFAPRSAMPAFGAFGSQQPSASLLFEKSNPGLRRSTPDSEALASSDDEPDHARTSGANSVKLPKPTRRTSWLNDVSAATLTRKTSGNIQYSPSTSNPGTPGADQSGWPQSISAANASAWNAAAASSPWNGIWSQDARREPPPRLQEVMHNAQGIPFSIPLQPTPKTYRSQSYSVGQLDTTSGPPSTGSTTTSNDGTRTRVGGQYPSLQRRASRPSGLGVLEEGGLGRLREVEDDEEQEQYFGGHPEHNNVQASRIAKLEFENAQLRHAAQVRDRTVSATTASSQPPNSAFRSLRSQGSMPESYDTAVDDYESMSGSGLLQRGSATRRMSEQAASTYERQPPGQPEGPGYDSSRKAYWQTSLGFGAIPEAPQSRRHSLADVPTRHGSFSSHGRNPIRTLHLSLETDTAGKDERQHVYDSLAQDISHGDDRKSALVPCQPSQSAMESMYLQWRDNAARYFNTNEDTRRLAEEHVQQSFMAGIPYSPHAHLGTYVGPSSQPLHIVNFKCCRSDVFYVQEGTGLHVNTGDLVIVEADRGTDLGTVQHTNVTWDEARRYKDHYAEEHYKWLMMFSQQSKNGGPNVINPNGLPTKPGSAVGGMGPPGHHNPHEPAHGELKPKMIKRLAQNHEIQSLKDKEGNEAKAKRVCQQKVADHRLTMEILDAEFQM